MHWLFLHLQEIVQLCDVLLSGVDDDTADRAAAASPTTRRGPTLERYNHISPPPLLRSLAMRCPRAREQCNIKMESHHDWLSRQPKYLAERKSYMTAICDMGGVTRNRWPTARTAFLITAAAAAARLLLGLCLIRGFREESRFGGV